MTDRTAPVPLGGPLQGGGAVPAPAFGPAGRPLVSGGSGTTVRLWDVATGAQIGAP
ncbi:hypothetical protein [Streptomyces sp. WAC06614]|uniref:hypothetical protein n=1 Tax=Streptomyces sp. WAC06614 TaxID=2487416 RepID=UPI00163BEA49|nr:hypothetical protein [Streptomyces sp. WAC06614]